MQELRAEAASILLPKLSEISVECLLSQQRCLLKLILESLRDFRLQTQHFAADRDEQVAKAAGPLEIVSNARIRRAGVARWEENVWELDVAVKRLRRENETSQSSLTRTLSRC